MPHIPDVYPPPWPQPPQPLLHHLHQIRCTGKILHDRIQYHRIEIVSGQALPFMRRLLPHFYPPSQPLVSLHLPLQLRHRRPRKIRCPILFTLRPQSRQDQPAPRPDLQHPLRLQPQNPLHRCSSPFLHLIQRYRSPIVAADPSLESFFLSPFHFPVKILIYALPLFQMPAFLPRLHTVRKPFFPPQNHISHQLLLSGRVFARNHHRFLHRRMLP